MSRLADIDWADDRGFGRDVGDFRAERMERLKITLLIVGGDLLPALLRLKEERQKAEGGGLRTEVVAPNVESGD